MGNVNMEAYQIHTTDKDAPNVQKALDILKTGESQTSEAVAVKADRIDIAPIFSTETAYFEGSMVYHSNRLYKFITDHAAGAWNAEEVEATNIDMAIQGAGGGASLPDYSTTEQATGQKWIDGKDIYFKTVVPAEELTLASQTWTATGESGANISTILNAFGVDANGTYFSLNATPDVSSTGYIGFLQTRSQNITITKFVIFYTKTA